MTMSRKQTQRDLRRLEKAERAAQLERSIENELKERLNKDIYGVYNIPFKKFDDVLDMQRNGVAAEEEEEEEAQMNEDDVLDDPVSKKAKGSSSYSKQNAGKRSRKVMTEVEQDEEMNTRQRQRA
uniref:Uncharacterized protein n=1 Tax=Zea mays TaxID=4577 RepID=A0A804N8G1_MAIZE